MRAREARGEPDARARQQCLYNDVHTVGLEEALLAEKSPPITPSTSWFCRFAVVMAFRLFSGLLRRLLCLGF